MDPQEQVRVQRPVVVPSHTSVDLVDGAGCRERGLAASEDDGHRHQERPAKAAEWMGSKVGVLVHTGRDLRMSQLHEKRSPAPKEQDVLTVDPAGYRIVAVKPGLHHAIKPL